MARAFPVAGSVYSYAQRGSINTSASSPVADAADYCDPTAAVRVAALRATTCTGHPKSASFCAFLVSATFVNLRGITFTARMNIFFLLAQLVVLGVFLFYAWTALHNGGAMAS